MSICVLHATDYNDVAKNGDYFRVSRDNTFLTKRISTNGSKKPANFPKRFRLGECHRPKDLESLLPILEGLGNDPHALIIRQEFTDAKIGRTVERKSKNVFNVKSRIIALDIDELDLPMHIESTDIKGQGDYVCNLLNKCNPEMFPDDMGFIAQGSSSAGLTKSIKLHLWLCNYDGVDQPQLRNLFYNINNIFRSRFKVMTSLVDTALYHDVQAHYTAYPIFEDSTQDPLKEDRTVYSYGNKCYVPASYSPYVKPIATTEMERSSYINAITGGIEPSAALERVMYVLETWDSARRGFRSKVQALYHSGLQDQFCMKTLDAYVTPIIERIRPGEAANYIAQGKTSAVNNIKACSTRELPHKCKGLNLETLSGGDKDKFLDFDKITPSDTVTFLKATLGTGKTHTIAQWLKGGQITGKFLALTDTSALVTSNATRFEAGDFRLPKARLDFATGKSDRLSGTLHSLLKIKEFTNSFDFLFIDEADSLINNLLFASIISEENKAQIVEILSDLLKNTDRVIISDGDISEETVNCYIDLMEGRRDLCRVNHQRKNLQGVQSYKHTTEASLWGALQGHLELGDKCLLVSDASPKELNEYVTTFDRLCPTKKVLVAHSAAKNDECMRDVIDNTTKALNRREVDALLCSPSITNGVDFNYFDAVFVLTKTENHTPNMRFQAMMREREPSIIHYYFRNMKTYCTGYNGLTLDTGFMAKSRQSLAVRREREYKTYIATFNSYLVDAGATVEVVDIPYDNPKNQEDRENQKIERINAILTSKPDCFPQRHNDAYEVKGLIKYYYDLEEEPSWDQVDMFLTDKPNERAAYLHKVFKDFWYVLSLCDPIPLERELRDKGFLFHLATGESTSGKVNKAKQILTRCGIKDNTDNAIAWYKKFCEMTPGAKFPDELKEVQEQARDL
jgi:hypothetical protein|tara:strand:+ start:937 stop:3666 length:2730 start_codon:yes stop_codon:yes gene_type:complete